MKRCPVFLSIEALCLAFLLVGCSERVPESGTALTAALSSTAPGLGAVVFRDVAVELGLDFHHQTGPKGRYAMPEIMGGGAAVFDHDGDGLVDIYLINSGNRLPSASGEAADPTAANRLYRQTALGGPFVDVTEASGLGDRGYGMGVAVGDYDNDGDLDVYVTNLGPDAMYRNEGGGRFVDVTRELGLGDAGWSSSASFFDYDRDGFLDLYVARYVAYDAERRCAQRGGQPDYCGPTVFAGLDDLLYHAEGGRRFVDVSAEAGLTGIEDAGLGVVCRDFDEDGWVDVYVANDADPNNLWINQRDGTFFDEAVFRGVAFNRYGAGEAGMGVTVGDADLDGDQDIFVTHLIDETNTYYRNLGDASFEDATAAVALGIPSLAFTGFGTAFFDADNDGDLDLAVANGATKKRPAALASRSDWFWNEYAEPNMLLENVGGGIFSAVVAPSGDFTEHVEVSRALIPNDFDGDGDLDLLVTNIDGVTRLYRNESGSEANWLSVVVWDPRVSREALGARVTIRTASRTVVRHVAPVGSYLSSSDATVRLGLGVEEGVEAFEVRWPDGTLETFPGTAARRSVTLRRGEGAAVEAGGGR